MTLRPNNPGKELRSRYAWLGAAFVAGLLLLTFRLYRLQVTHGAEYAQKSEANFIKPIPIPADRGMIMDANGRILVDNRPSFDAFVTPAFCSRCEDHVLPQLAEWLDWDEEELARMQALVKAKGKTSERFQRVPVRVDLTRDEMDLLLSHQRDLEGLDVEPVPHRSYRAGTVLSHVLGYMNEITQVELEQKVPGRPEYHLGDYVGRRGIERALEEYLRGKDGLRREVVDAHGRVFKGLAQQLGMDTIKPEAGLDVVTTLDYRLQETAEKAFPGVAGAVVVVDVRTGSILAVVSRPGFDPNVLSGRVSAKELAELNKDPLTPLIFRGTQNHFSPGSTFKVVTALAALQSRHFRPSTTVNCSGGYKLGSRRWRCHKESGHGGVDLRRALQVSCDTWFYRVADVLGINPIAKVGRELGLGAPTGLGVVADISGIMPDEAYHARATPGGYYKGHSLNTAIGQGDVNVTPLQLAMVYAALGNGGKVYQPQLVKRVEAQDGTVVKTFEPKLLRELAVPAALRKVVVDGLVAVVNEPGGTAYSQRIKGLEVAGKTGTAQVKKLGDVRLKTEQMDYWSRDHAWFAAFAPSKDPEIAVVVLNEHGGHGGTDAAPTAMAVFKRYFELKGEPPPVGREPVERIALKLPPRPPPPPVRKRPEPRPAKKPAARAEKAAP
ncbi:MAG: hypothetical protein RL653_3734 [Pseudomonadota bacterium]